MPETICKFQPDRTIYLRGFNTFAAAASIHSASPTGFKVSGTFRDPADFAVAVLYDADNYFEHPSIRYLPDFNLAGLTLNFDLHYSDALQPIDSPKFNWIDWATLDCIREDGTTAQIRLFDHAMLTGSTFPAASVMCPLITSGPGVQPFDRATLWYQNLAFDYIVPAGDTSVEFAFFAHGTGTTHTITINGVNYSHTETVPAGESSADQASALISALAGNAYVTAGSGSGSNTVRLTVLPAHDGVPFSVSASDGNSSATMCYTSPDFVAAQIAAQITATNWATANTPHALLASVSGAAITLTAARYGTATVSGTSLTIPPSTSPVTVFSGITAGSPILIGGVANTVAAVLSPTQLTLAVAATSGTGVAWVAPRGGYDGNLIELYSLSKTSTLSFDQPQYQLAGGSSDVTWNCTVDFTALGIDRLRQCWLTFAPALVTGTYAAREWDATFSNWALTGSSSVQQLQVAGPGSIRIEQSDTACRYTGAWTQEAGFYSKYFASVAPAPFQGIAAGSPIVIAGVTYTVASVESPLHLTLTAPAVSGTGVAWSASPARSGLAAVSGISVTSDVWDPNASVTITYICQFTHDLWIGTSLYSDRANAGVSVDGDTETPLTCQLAVASAVVTRRQARSGIPAGRHTVTIRPTSAGYFYFNFLEAVVASAVPDALAPRTNISPSLDFDTDHSYKLSPARLMWIMDKLGYAGPMNEYLGVFWWNERRQIGASFSTATVNFGGTFAGGDTVLLTLNSSVLGKTVLPIDTPDTIAFHFAASINGAFVGVWASAVGSVLTITGRSADPAYNISLTISTTSALGTAAITSAPLPGQDGTWVIDDTVSPPLNYATRAWHADYYSQCASRTREVVTSCSMELVNPPAGYAARFPDGSEVATATGFGSLFSTQCAIGASAVLAYQKAVYRCIAGLQVAAGLTPCIQFGEFLWWFFPKSGGGMGYYDAETTAAALAALGRPLHVFTGQDDDPTVNGGADALFLRNRLRDHIAALVADIGLVFSNTICELLWPYDVNYPSIVPGSSLGGRLNYAVNLPLEWKTQPTSGLTRMKVEALAFGSSVRNLDLAREAIELFPSFGWPLDKLRYLVPVFGSACPWHRELALALGAGIRTNNLWAFDHICLFNLKVPEGSLERRSFVKST